MIRALVTGAGGFVGGYLTKHLMEHGRYVVAATRLQEVVPACHDRCTLDITDPDSVAEAYKAAAPDEVYHLAAIASPVAGAPVGYARVNVEGTLHVLQGAQLHSPQPRVLVVTTGLVYGPYTGKPATEQDLLCPRGLYAASKAGADLLAGSYGTGGLAVLRARPFNHTGPGQTADFLASSVCRQIAEIACGRREPRVELGNLYSRRDFTDVRDVVSAYRLMMDKGVTGEAYNICSGGTVSVEELTRLALSVRGISAEIQSKSQLRRGGDIDVLAGDPTKLHGLGWSRSFPLERTLSDLVSYWEDRIRHEDSSGS